MIDPDGLYSLNSSIHDPLRLLGESLGYFALFDCHQRLTRLGHGPDQNTI